MGRAESAHGRNPCTHITGLLCVRACVVRGAAARAGGGGGGHTGQRSCGCTDADQGGIGDSEAPLQCAVVQHPHSVQRPRLLLQRRAYRNNAPHAAAQCNSKVVRQYRGSRPHLRTLRR